MPQNGHLKWSATYQPGKVVAVGYKNGKRILTQTIETTKQASRVRLTADRKTIAADGRDVAIVTVEVQDAKGRTVPDACPLLTLQLEGDGRILGVGNGDPAFSGSDHPSEKDCHSFQLPAFNGLAQIIIQSGHSTGALSLTCNAQGMKAPAKLLIQAE